MYKNEVKVYDEDLAIAKLSDASTVSDKTPVRADGTMNALIVNVFANDAVTIAAGKTVTVSVLGAGADEDTFVEVASGTFTGATGGSSYVKDDLIGRISLPFEAPALVKANVASSDTTGNAGTVRVTLGYLPR